MAENSRAEDAASDSVESAKSTGDKKEKLTDQVMQNPQVLAALQDRLDNAPHTPSSYIETLPKAVKRRIDALKQLQVKCAHTEAKFYEEVHDLERKYAALYQPLFDKRRDFIIGNAEPTEAEAEWHSENEDEEKLAGDLKNKVVIEEKEAGATEETNPKGIPDFWFTIFRNVDMLSELVQEYDEPILKHLQDIKVKFSEPGQPMSFTLEFHFEPNDYFTNSVLTKTYKMKSEPDKTDPFSFEGPEIVDCEGFLGVLSNFVSPAKLISVPFTSSSKSVIQIVKNIEPLTDPYGTPLSMSLQFEKIIDALLIGRKEKMLQ
ncbi:nucleosome assembly protein 1-like 4 isoform 4-T5 [Vipera latastei]